MTASAASRRTPLAVLVLHVAALAAGLVFVWTQIDDVRVRQAGIAAAQAMNDALDARLAGPGKRPDGAADPVAADPFLQGASATVASAALQSRIVSAIRDAGGTVTSSQIDMTGAGAGATPPVIVLTVSCQLADAALQGLLYGLEAGTPALFVDQLSIEAVPTDRAGAPGGGRALAVAMTVSAYWKG